MTRRITVRSGSVPRKVSPPASVASVAGVDTDAIHDNVDGEISEIATKGSPANADFLLIEDAAADNAKKRITIGDLPGAGGAAYLALVGPFPAATTIQTAKSKGGRFYNSQGLTVETLGAWASTWVNADTYVFKLLKFNPGGSLTVDSVVAEKSYVADGTEGANSLVTVTLDASVEIIAGEVYGVICYRSAGSFPSRYSLERLAVGPGISGLGGIRYDGDVVATTTMIDIPNMYSTEFGGTI